MNGDVREPQVAPPCAVPSRGEVTQLLDAWEAGDGRALDHLIPLVVGDLRRLARRTMSRQAPGHTWQPTALVHEAYLRLAGSRPPRWENREHFLAYMATAMRRLLLNHDRDRDVVKRGGGAAHLPFDDALDVSCDGGACGVDLLDLDRALGELEALDPRAARVVELRFFTGLSVEETAQVLGISPRSVKREWQTARLWLLRVLSGG